MPETQVQHARGTTTDFASYTGPAGEICVNTDDYSLRVQDGVTIGGWVIKSVSQREGDAIDFAIVAAVLQLGGVV
jgi:hypothetical protein